MANVVWFYETVKKIIENSPKDPQDVLEFVVKWRARNPKSIIVCEDKKTTMLVQSRIGVDGVVIADTVIDRRAQFNNKDKRAIVGIGLMDIAKAGSLLKAIYSKPVRKVEFIGYDSDVTANSN